VWRARVARALEAAKKRNSEKSARYPISYKTMTIVLAFEKFIFGVLESAVLDKVSQKSFCHSIYYTTLTIGPTIEKFYFQIFGVLESPALHRISQWFFCHSIHYTTMTTALTLRNSISRLSRPRWIEFLKSQVYSHSYSVN